MTRTRPDSDTAGLRPLGEDRVDPAAAERAAVDAARATPYAVWAPDAETVELVLVTAEPGALHDAEDRWPAAAVVAIERIDLDRAVGRPQRVVRGEDARGQHDLVFQADREQCGRRDAPGEQSAVDVRQRLENARGLVAVRREVLPKLGERPERRLGDRPGKVAQERHVGHDGGDLRVQRRGRDRDATTLTAAQDGDTLGVDPVESKGGVDRAHGVGVDATVVSTRADRGCLGSCTPGSRAPTRAGRPSRRGSTGCPDRACP